MITLVTGFNDTGKTDWIHSQIPNFDSCFGEDFNSKICYYSYPECKLHPSEQSKLVESYINFHSEGFNIYIETHSDHIVNTICCALKSSILSVFDLRIVFFTEEKEMIEIVATQGGRIRQTPKGFFDEIGKALRILI